MLYFITYRAGAQWDTLLRVTTDCPLRAGRRESRSADQTRRRERAILPPCAVRPRRKFRCRRPAGETMHPKGKHTRNRAIRYRTSACQNCQINQQCTPGYQQTIPRPVDQGALDRMERRVHENPDLMKIHRCTVEHPFGTIKRRSGGGRFLTRGLRRVKAEATLSVLAFNIIRASNALGTGALTIRG